MLEKAGYVVDTEKVSAEELADSINENEYVALIVRSATRVTKELIDKCPSLRLIARGGVGMDNIDVEYAKLRNIQVVNTPAASSLSVAELVIAHIFIMSRKLDVSNREMPHEGHKDFLKLKKRFSEGTEVTGKWLGIIGFGRIGQAVAALGLRTGMNVIVCDPYINEAKLDIVIQNVPPFKLQLKTSPLDEVLSKSDFITLHVPGGEHITKKEIEKMKKGVMLINASRGGVINEHDLLKGLETGHVAHAALDVFEHEPAPNNEILMHPRISLSPHIGGSTAEAQKRIALELAEKIIYFLA